MSAVTKPHYRVMAVARPVQATGMNDFRSWVSEVGGTNKAAEILHVTPGAIRHWVNGIRRPRPEMAEKIEKVSNGRINRTSLLWPDRVIHPPREAA